MPLVIQFPWEYPLISFIQFIQAIRKFGIPNPVFFLLIRIINFQEIIFFDFLTTIILRNIFLVINCLV